VSLSSITAFFPLMAASSLGIRVCRGGGGGTDRSRRRKRSEEHGEQREVKILLLSGVQAAAATGSGDSGLWREGWVDKKKSHVGHQR
jgi:hypothetical protein